MANTRKIYADFFQYYVFTVEVRLAAKQLPQHGGSRITRVLGGAPSRLHLPLVAPHDDGAHD